MKMNDRKLIAKIAKINGKTVSTATKREVQIDYSDPEGIEAAPEIGPHRWVVAMTTPRSDRRAISSLSENGYAVFQPVITEWRRHGWKQFKRTRPLFPGYVFVGLLPGPVLSVRQCDSIASIVSDVSGPLFVRSCTVMALSDAMMAGRFDQTAEPARHSFAVGEPVVISDGPFAGHAASIAAMIDSDRVAILLSILGAERSLSVDTAILRKAGG